MAFLKNNGKVTNMGEATVYTEEDLDEAYEEGYVLGLKIGGLVAQDDQPDEVDPETFSEDERAFYDLGYDTGYQHGYDAGILDADHENVEIPTSMTADDAYDQGYADGYHDGQMEVDERQGMTPKPPAGY